MMSGPMFPYFTGILTALLASLLAVAIALMPDPPACGRRARKGRSRA